jgi:predicted RNA-binding protein with PUA-like domain
MSNEPLATEIGTRPPSASMISQPCPKQTTAWDGVRNYQARNMLRDSMKKGDTAFFYHSSCEVPGIAGIVSVVKERLSGCRPPSTASTITTMPTKPDAAIRAGTSWT